MNVKGKVIIITGASKGIGKSTADILYKEGAKVVLVARSIAQLKEMSSKMTDSLALKADMTIPEDISQMVRETYEHYGRIDVLINNAGQALYSPFELIGLDNFKKIMDLNVYGPLLAMQAVIPIMRNQGGGTIVNISSMVTKVIFQNLSPYAATKCALNMLSWTARQELEKDNITVSIVYPRLTETDFAKNAIRSDFEFVHPRSRANFADTPELVAEKILQVIQTGEAEVYLK
jgi:short-subunit dehydrogenase